MLCALCSILYWIIGVVVFVLALGWWTNGYFRRRGVKGPIAYLPFFGNMLRALRRTIHFKDFVYQLYMQFPDEKFIGFQQFHNPMLVIRDVELIKQITVKDFDHFVDRAAGFDESTDLLFGNSLLNLRGQKWRDMRTTLSPAFTSSKIKGMFQFIVECGEQMTDYYMDEMSTSMNKVRGVLEVEMKDAFTRYANDVIATTAFGLEVNSFIEKENTFYVTGKDATDFSGSRFFKLFILTLFPKISKIFKMQLLSKETTNFFKSLVWDTMKDREERKIVRNDMIQLLMQARKGTLKHDHKDIKDAGFAAVEESVVGKTDVKRAWTDDEIVAQAVLFFIAGFDTSSTLLCFMAHELATHPNVLKKLQKEIDEVHAGCLDGRLTYILTYDKLQNMKYLDMVVSETLRLWPPAVVMDRKCVKSYTLPPPNDSSTQAYEMKTGDKLWIPTYAIHRDPKYFRDPDMFDPERFSEENKHNIQSGSYMPFGIGPRNCIGSRFALMEAKAVIYNLLRRFDFITTAKTQNPIKMDVETFSLQPERGFWVGMRPRFKRLLSNQFDDDNY